MNSPLIQKSTLDFLKKLNKNNNREWFNAHKEQYLAARENTEQFMDGILYLMSRHDQFDTLSGKKSLYRVYNDVRFSKNKLPYNPWLSGHLKRSKPLLRGGYYIRIMPGQSRISCGFAYPNPEDLNRMRLDISANHKEWKKLLNAKALRTHFGQMQGEQVRTTPRGFSSEDPAIDLLRYKQYWFVHHFTDDEVIASDFPNKINTIFKSIRPFFDYTSEVLTTDLNGESLYK